MNQLKTFPATYDTAGNFYILQQDSMLVHHACNTINMLQRKMPDVTTPDLWPTICPDFNQWIKAGYHEPHLSETSEGC